MEKKLKLISVRIDPMAVERIDQFRRRHTYWKRNSVINGVLSSVLRSASDEQIYDLVRYAHSFTGKLAIKVTIGPIDEKPRNDEK